MYFLNDSLISLQYVLDNECKNAQKVILLDENTKKHCLPILLENVNGLKDALMIEIESGEKNKNEKNLIKIISALVNVSADKGTVFLSLGGGVITDLGGLAAALYYRGIRHIEIPTTLLGMVDASIGGKNGINFGELKNQIGTITRPFFTCFYLPFLRTLGKRQISNGAAEMIKLALVADKAMWDKMKTKSPIEIGQDEGLITRCIELKQRICDEDFNDVNKRRILNFGHNFGHAIEAFALKHSFDILHGESIARGMYYETILSRNILGFDTKEYSEILAYIQRYYAIKRTVDQYLQLLDYLRHDKKTFAGDQKFTLLQEIGYAKTNITVSEGEIMKLLLILQSH
ncbi:MAG: 3-dehydroquinate synthase [Bacteroidales bacterium]|jgi:3-dehydroquinate synthase|nr:3-dehydroquinate synthase [Bacteroidales bacterium]